MTYGRRSYKKKRECSKKWMEFVEVLKMTFNNVSVFQGCKVMVYFLNDEVEEFEFTDKKMTIVTKDGNELNYDHGDLYINGEKLVPVCGEYEFVYGKRAGIKVYLKEYGGLC